MTVPRRVAPLVLAGATLSLGAADAGAATYVARPADGGRMVLELEAGRVRSVQALLPAHCFNNSGRSWDSTLAIDLDGAVALRSGRFAIQGRQPDRVRYELDGRLGRGAIAGGVRLTYLKLDFVGPSDDSYLCDTSRLRYRGVRRR